jgi:hypothetical protein
VGDVVVIAVRGVADSGFPRNVVRTIATVPTTTTFTYADPGSNAASITGEYYVHKALVSNKSSNAAEVNRIEYSKYQQSESVALKNYLYVGARNKAILRIVPLRDRLYVFKEDGVFTVSGDDPYLRVDSFDSTVKLVSPDSAVVLNNRIYCHTNQGVVAISDGGVQIISRPIEDSVLPLLSSTGSWGCAYDSDRCYLLGLSSSSSYSASEIWVYNYLVDAWTRWTPARTCAAVDPANDVLYLGGTSAVTYKERKTRTYIDYADASTSINVTYTAGSRSCTTASTSGLSAGTYIIPGGNPAAVVVSVDSGTAFTISTAAVNSATQATTVFTPFTCTVEWLDNAAGDPHTSKQFREATLHFQKANYYAGSATFKTDLSTSSATSSLQSTSFSAGAEPTEIMNKRLLVPAAKQRGNLVRVGFSIAEAMASWQLAGYTLEIDGVSQRNVR